ncbi:hypothetical protein PUN28_005922 [Cardiocondyla obscurior]
MSTMRIKNMKTKDKITDSNKNAGLPCICNRPHTIIICNSCGFWTRGRVRAHCPQHPTVVFLHDYSQCPRCKSYTDMLTEI